MSPSPNSQPSRRHGAAILVLVLALGGGAALILNLGSSVEAMQLEVSRLGESNTRMTEALESVSRSLKLLRMERSATGRGIHALIERIEHWAPELQSSATSLPAIREIERNLNDVFDAVEALGPDAFVPLEDAMVASSDDEVRKWLMSAMLRADHDRGRNALSEVLKNTHRSKPSARLRMRAADELLAVDKELAGQILKVILEFESANGITRPLHPHYRNQPEAVIPTNRIPEFFNFISRFVASGHPDVDGVLRQIIGRAEHDRMTYQECVKELGRMRTRLAADRIRELFEKPPFRERSPIFQNHCLQAIADIEGQEACSYFEEQLRKVDDKNVVTKLQSLVKQLCQ